MQIIMKQNLYALFFASMLTFSVGGCIAQTNAISSFPEPATIMTNKQPLINDVNKFIADAKLEMNQGHWEQANLYLKNGLLILGDPHFNPNVIDDSGMNLAIADGFEREGNFENSARTRLPVLEDRFDQFKANSTVFDTYGNIAR